MYALEDRKKSVELYLSMTEILQGERLEKMSLIKNGKLTRAAILLFHPHPEYFFGGAHIKLGYFNEKNQLRYQDELYGSLLSLAKQAEELLVLKYFYATIEYDGLVRVETLPYPREAVREGILNALMHNNYMSDQPIAIRVSPYEMRITNRCVFPSGWTEETLFSVHDSRQLNPNIAVGFFRAGLVERFGSGIQKIVDFCKENGNPRPHYLIQPDMITLIMASRAKNIELALGHKLQNDDVNGSINLKDGSLNGRLYDTDGSLNFNPSEKKERNSESRYSVLQRKKLILSELKEKPESTVENMISALSIPERTIYRDIDWLKEHGYLERFGSKKSGSWHVIKELE